MSPSTAAYIAHTFNYSHPSPLPTKEFFLQRALQIVSPWDQSFEPECTIYKEEYVHAEDAFEDMEAPVRIFSCNHFLGDRCLMIWLDSTPESWTRDIRHHNTCPYCTTILFAKPKHATAGIAYVALRILFKISSTKSLLLALVRYRAKLSTTVK
ncbi:hypothetical protein K432DRAFT_97035 [Lepidopterella palustris CBS 459.81]|uniref:RING-type domain-containing protein n=1 Tax=Lepidopterella palustris CBS 459.81 TaxID=1314670 RepID=A0A8E2E6Y9_9PEZI|nr:hypothetical protein K432DRAFT_97035 [Lepidopterella palustris CBS 459.81]